MASPKWGKGYECVFKSRIWSVGSGRIVRILWHWGPTSFPPVIGSVPFCDDQVPTFYRRLSFAGTGAGTQFLWSAGFCWGQCRYPIFLLGPVQVPTFYGRVGFAGAGAGTQFLQLGGFLLPTGAGTHFLQAGGSDYKTPPTMIPCRLQWPIT